MCKGQNVLLEHKFRLHIEDWKLDFCRRLFLVVLAIDGSIRQTRLIKFDMSLEVRERFLQKPVTIVTAKTDQSTFRIPLFNGCPYATHTRWVFGDIEHRTQDLSVWSSVLWLLGYHGRKSYFSLQVKKLFSLLFYDNNASVCIIKVEKWWLFVKLTYLLQTARQKNLHTFDLLLT